MPSRPGAAAEFAEVETPLGERHAYVLDRGDCTGTVLSDELEKRLHVSPLMSMDQTYAFRHFPHPHGRRPKGFVAP